MANRATEDHSANQFLKRAKVRRRVGSGVCTAGLQIFYLVFWATEAEGGGGEEEFDRLDGVGGCLLDTSGGTSWGFGGGGGGLGFSL